MPVSNFSTMVLFRGTKVIEFNIFTRKANTLKSLFSILFVSVIVWSVVAPPKTNIEFYFNILSASLCENKSLVTELCALCVMKQISYSSQSMTNSLTIIYNLALQIVWIFLSKLVHHDWQGGGGVSFNDSKPSYISSKKAC